MPPLFPPPPHLAPSRLGPRPLPLHLLSCWSFYTSSLPASLLWSNGWPILKEGGPPLPTNRTGPPGLARAAIPGADGEGNKLDPLAFLQAVELAGRRRFSAFLTGVQRYRSHEYRRELPDPPILGRWGEIRLLDYGGTGPPVLCVPSLINRAYILDLTAERSFLRWLSEQGVRPLLLDWGNLTRDTADFTLTDYIEGPLFEALSLAFTCFGERVGLLGYCMGGLLTLAAAQRHPALVARLLLLATPWDFHGDTTQMRRLSAFLPALMQVIDRHDALPVDVLQMLFAGLDPLQILRKFEIFSRLSPDSASARAFVALEDWLNDGVPLAAPVARECFGGWYCDNSPLRGRWRIAGRAVQAASVTVPTLVLIPKNDRIVPPASAKSLAQAIPGAEMRILPLGHIGMMVSATAQVQVWDPIRNFLLEKCA